MSLAMLLARFVTWLFQLLPRSVYRSFIMWDQHAGCGIVVATVYNERPRR